MPPGRTNPLRTTAKPKEETTGSVAEAVAAAIHTMKKKLTDGEMKPTVAEFARLLELQRELVQQDVKHIKVTWVDSLNETEYTTEL